MKKRIFFLLTALLLIVGMGTTVFAQEVPDSSQNGYCSIYIDLNYAEGTGTLGSLTIYQVGVIREEDGNYSFVPAGSFADKWDRYEDVRSAELARELEAFATEGRLEGITEAVQDDGTVTFSGLELGLYLVTQQEAASGYEKINPFLIGVPGNENGTYVYQVDASPKVQPETVPTEPTEPEPTEPPEPELPYTGQLNWPVPLLAVLGLGLFVLGWGLRFGKRENADEG